MFHQAVEAIGRNRRNYQRAEGRAKGTDPIELGCTHISRTQRGKQSSRLCGKLAVETVV